jgi:hypothetical protein
MLPQQGREFAPLDNHEFAIAHRNSVRRSGSTVEQCDLTEDLAFAYQVENSLTPVSSRCADLHAAGQDGDQLASCIALPEDRGAALDLSFRQISAELLDACSREFAENRVIAKDREGVDTSSHGLSRSCAGPLRCPKPYPAVAMAKGDFSIFLDQVPSLATGTSLILLLARHACLTVLFGIAAPPSE